MEVLHQVFVSSTYLDLKEERQQVIQALLELDCIPSGMELFPATDDSLWEFIERVIRECDYYLVIIGGRYGTTDASGLSYTEREYDYAVKVGKPILAMIHADVGSIPSSRTETTDAGRQKLEAFRAKAERRNCRRWHSKDDLPGHVSVSVAKLKKSNPAEGWVRKRYATDPAVQQEHTRTKARLEELEREVERRRSTPPSGAENFDGGECEFEFSGRVYWNRGGESRRDTFRRTWNAIFCAMGTRMYNPITESAMKMRLQDVLRGDLPGDEPSAASVVEVRDMDFQTMKVQLAALGLFGRPDHDPTRLYAETTWMLTAYGERELVSLLARHREARVAG